MLVVDDSVDTRELLSLVLGLEGADVQSAETGRDALALADSLPPNVILCDIGLPDIDGCELLVEIRKRPPERGGTALAIALTGYSGSEVTSRIFAAGYQLHVVKPVDPNGLIDQVLGLLERDA